MNRRTAVAAAAVTATLALAVPACTDLPATEARQADVQVCAPGAVVEGIDVSTYQGNIDWPAVKAGGIEFAIIRTSDGLDFPDNKFAQNWSGAKSSGVIRGVYQFFEPAQDPIAQADMMLAAMGPLSPGDLAPTIDVEVTGGKTPAELAAGVKAWVQHVAATTGRAPMIYVGQYFWQDNVGNPDMSGYPLWEAQWGVTCPSTPSTWPTWTFWQYTATGAVAGINTGGGMDLDRFNGDLAALAALGGATIACGDGTCSVTEDSDSCPSDCPPCGVVDASGGVVDDGDACFIGGGDPQYMRAVDGSGWESDLLWTHATSDAAEANSATWDLHLAEAGHYRVEVYTAATFAQSKEARYVVAHAGATDAVVVDQSAADGWQTVGDFAFASGGKQSIHLGDNTGEALSANVQVVFDAVRLTRLDPTDPGGGGGSGSGSGSGTGGSLWSGCSAGGGGGAGAVPIVLAFAMSRRRRRPRR